MIFERKIRQPTAIIWVLLISTALICAQGTKLHVHYMDCQHDSSIEMMQSHEDDHGHALHGIIHLTTHGADQDHSDTGITELDVSPQGLLKKLTSVFSLLLAITCLFVFLRPAYTRQFFRRQTENLPLAFSRYALSPPLRAPPQH